MPESTRVTLARDHQPTFPSNCAGCSTDYPDREVTFVGHAFHPAHLIFFWFLGQKVFYEVPLCSDCADRHARVLRSRWWVHVTVVCAAVLLVWSSLEWASGPLRNFLIVVALLGSLSPALFFKALLPPPIDLSVEPDWVRFEFRDEAYGSAFRDLNPEYSEKAVAEPPEAENGPEDDDDEEEERDSV